MENEKMMAVFSELLENQKEIARFAKRRNGYLAGIESSNGRSYRQNSKSKTRCDAD